MGPKVPSFCSFQARPEAKLGEARLHGGPLPLLDLLHPEEEREEGEREGDNQQSQPPPDAGGRQHRNELYVLAGFSSSLAASTIPNPKSPIPTLREISPRLKQIPVAVPALADVGPVEHVRNENGADA